MRPTRRAQPYRKGQGTRVPGQAMQNMQRGGPMVGSNPADTTRALQKGNKLGARLNAVAGQVKQMSYRPGGGDDGSLARKKKASREAHEWAAGYDRGLDRFGNPPAATQPLGRGRRGKTKRLPQKLDALRITARNRRA